MSRLRRFVPSPAMAVAVAALVVAIGGQAAYAAATNFLLNTTNTSTAQTTLNGSAMAGKALQITNTNTGSGATALGLNVASGHAPFTVTSTTKVAKLNADLLDGLDSTALQQRVGGACAAGSAMTAIATSGSVSCAVLPTPSLLLNGLGVGGPFPPSQGYVAQVTVHGGALLVSFDVSAFATNADTPLNAQFLACASLPCDLSGTYHVLGLCSGYTNEAESHKTLVASTELVTLPAGTYYLNIIMGNGLTLMDSQDVANYTITEFAH